VGGIYVVRETKKKKRIAITLSRWISEGVAFGEMTEGGCGGVGHGIRILARSLVNFAIEKPQKRPLPNAKNRRSRMFFAAKPSTLAGHSYSRTS